MGRSLQKIDMEVFHLWVEFREGDKKVGLIGANGWWLADDKAGV